jgi:hypothetical protein
MVQVHSWEKIDGEDRTPFLMARPDPDYKDLFRDAKEDGWLFTSADGSLEFLMTENAVKVVDLKENGGEIEVDLFVDRGRTAQIAVQDADGNPLSGVVASGITAHWPVAYKLKNPTATVVALDPEKPRRLVFLHPEKKLGGSVTMRGDEKEPVVVKLAPLGAMTARFVDLDGAPLAGAEVSLYYNDRIVAELYRFLERTMPPATLDKDGRFTLPNIIADVKFATQTHKGETYYVGEPKIGERLVKPGQTLDLGERKLKPQQ